MRPTVVVGGQAGSEGKGAICAHLHKFGQYGTAVRVGGPNAGHSAVDKDGRKWALRQLPVAAVIDPECDLIIAAGSEVDFAVLEKEIRETQAAGHHTRGRVFLDQEATVINDDAIMLEASIGTGTTGKGIGGARAQRALRAATLVRHWNPALIGAGIKVMDTQGIIRDRVLQGHNLLLEGTQGYILGSHAGEYPYSTSGDCRAIDFMAAAGMPPMEVDTVVVLRMHPIRIAGNSGPLSNETTWEAIGVPPEQTTVTHKVRRVGAWDQDWAIRSIRTNNAQCVALTFVDYEFPGLAGVDGPQKKKELPARLREFLVRLEGDTGARVDFLGTGPNTVIEVY